MECIACGLELRGDESRCPGCGLSYVTAELAGGERRATAAVIDLLIAALALGPAAGADYLIGVPFLTIYMGLGYAVWCLILMRGGQTPGLNLLGLKVVDGRGVTIGLWRYLLHRMVIGTLLPAVASFGVYLLLDLLWPFWDQDRQALHDKIAGTYVVEAARAMEPGAGAGFSGDGSDEAGTQGLQQFAAPTHNGTGHAGAPGRSAWTG